MRIATLALAGLTAVSVLAPLSAQAHPDWGRGHDGRAYYGGREGRDHGWREPRGAWGWYPGWGGYAYRPHCWTEQRGHYLRDGYYVYRPVTVCR
jgi:hypothetical protein